jgi:membrane fusion protein (multidrug efflux system)
MAFLFAPLRYLALSLVALLAACSQGESNTPAPAATAAPAPAVTVVRVARQDVTPRTTFTGRVEAMDKVDLLARVNGFLQKRLFEEGADVKEGEVLFVLEKSAYQAAVTDAKGAIARAEGALKLANLEVGRFQDLVARKAAPQNELDVHIAKQTEARGELMQAQAALQRAELDLGYTDVTAPLPGRIGRAAFSVGNYVGPTSGALATIVRQDPIYVVFPVSMRLLIELRRQQLEKGEDPRAVQVKLRLADGSMYDHVGRVNFMDVQVNQGTDTVAIRAELPNRDRILVDGALVTAVIESTRPKQAIVLPAQALQADQSGTYVLVVDGDNKVQVRPVQIDEVLEGKASLTTGLREGERVIVEGIPKVRPGIVANATEAPAKPAGGAP